MTTSQVAVCEVFGKSYEFSSWAGSPLKCSNGKTIIGFKLIFLESERPQLLSPQDIEDWTAKATCFVATGGLECVVAPLSLLEQFILSHKNYDFLTPNVEFDFPLASNFLSKLPDQTSFNCFQELVNQNKMKDPVILDALLRLAETDAAPTARSVAEIVKTYHYDARRDTDNDEKTPQTRPLKVAPQIALSPEILSENEAVDSGLRDLISLLPVYHTMASRAVRIMSQYPEIYPHALQRYGPLSECIQVKATIALSQISVNGMTVNEEQYTKVQQAATQTIKDSISEILSHSQYKGVFKLKDGTDLVEWDQEQGRPSICQEKLREIFQQVTNEIESTHSIDIKIPYSKTGKIATTKKAWGDYEDYHPFLKLWIKMEQALYFQTSLRHIKPGVIHPTYTPFVRNGRTSCSSPSIQQSPRTGGFREMFTAREGHLLVIIDYNFIELCTLAIVCEVRYGHSTLANVIRNGLDPHSFTASIFERIPFEEFMSWQNSSDPELRQRYKTKRQQAKAINFGIPSGLQAAGISHYARTSYGVEMTKEESLQFRHMLITDIYPELSFYLQDREFETLAGNLGCSVPQLYKKVAWNQVDDAEKSAAVAGGVRNIIRGKAKKDGKDYKPQFVNKVWAGLDSLAPPEISLKLLKANHQGSEELFKELLGHPVATLTGRVRGKVGFTQSCNTPFSGLAADGAKLALWNLNQVGFRIMAFIHDEMVIEIREDSDWDQEIGIINAIVCRSMAELTGTIPIKCSVALSRMWSKDAVAVYENGSIRIWDPSS